MAGKQTHERVIERALLRLAKTCHVRVGLTGGKKAQLPRDQGRDAGVAVHQPAVERLAERLAGKSLGQGLPGLGPGVQLALRGGLVVKQTRQDLPFFGHFKVHPTQAVQHPTVGAHQDQIGVAAHEL